MVKKKKSYACDEKFNKVRKNYLEKIKRDRNYGRITNNKTAKETEKINWNGIK